MVCFPDIRSRLCRLAIRLGLLSLVPMFAWSQGTYSTTFPLTENPISEAGKWINGGTTGSNWTNVRTTPGLAFGTQTGSNGYDDSTAVLTGTWGPNQTAQATVRVISASGVSNVFEEVEIRLHTTISANSITGYEINCSVSTNSNNFYLQLVRWNGALSNFTPLNSVNDHCVDGDTLKASIDSAGHITIWHNGIQAFTYTDTTYVGGSPGVGFFLEGGTSSFNSNFGFSSFTATDGSSSSFSISATPGSQTVTAGGNAAYTVTVTPSGSFTGAVNLSATGQPSGSTASFNPTSITTSGSSTLTLTSTSATPAGSYPITIKGTSGSITQTASATFVVNTASGSGTSSTCDLNSDGSTNVVDVQLAVNKYLSCTAGPNVSSQSFVGQVINGALGSSCSVTAGARTVVLNWTASTTPNVNYNVYRATASGGYTTSLNSSPISGTSFADCSVTPGLTYYYVIRSVDSTGTESGNSSEVVAAVPSS